MKKRTRSGATIVVASMIFLVAAGAAADAFVLADPKADKDAIGNRTDIAGQTGKFVGCLRKAVETCQRDQNPGFQSCFFTNSVTAPTTSFTGTDPKGKGIAAKFEAATQKCIASGDFAKKGARGASSEAKYRALGCPFQCNRVTPGQPHCADLTTFQQAWLIERINEQGYLTGAMRALSIKTNPSDMISCVLPATADPKEYAEQARVFDRCVTSAVDAVVKYQAALRKCQTACETDYAGKKGGGGPTDGPPACGLGVADPNDPLTICVAKATAALNRKPLPYGLVSAIASVHVFLEDANRNLFNSADSCLPPS